MYKFQRLLSYSLVIAIIVHCTYAFHITGHMTLAQIAENVLKEESPDIYQRAVKLLIPYSRYTGEGKYPFVECAPWADRIVAAKADQTRTWHFDNEYLSLDGTKVPQSSWDKDHTAYNITFVIESSLKTLRDSPLKHNSQYDNTDHTLMESITLRNVIHYFGDVHQPLHTCTAVYKRQPTGDMGGNLFKIKTRPNEQGTKNLHFAWDAAFFQFPTIIGSPLKSNSEKDILEGYAKDLMAKYDFKYFEDKGYKLDNTAMDWALEGKKICEEFAYKEAHYGSELTDEYIQRGAEITGERIVLGGYRLAKALQTY